MKGKLLLQLVFFNIFFQGIVFIPNQVKAQELSADSLFTLAKQSAFAQKKYPQAIAHSKQALKKNPDYLDIQIFMGRIYSWTNKLDSARIVFDDVLKKDPQNKEALFAYASMEYWNNGSEKALALCNTALNNYPDEHDFLLLKTRVLTDLKRFEAANAIATQLVSRYPKDTEVRSIVERLREFTSKNQVGVNYTYTGFDKQFDTPWHLMSVDYSRQTKIGSVVPRITYANKFGRGGLQFETDFYPHISERFYAYVNAGYSNDVGIFPKYRGGFSLFANLPYSIEASVGFRYMYFSNSTLMYTGSIGKYYKSYLFTFRTYLTPGESKLSQSYSANIRYYYRGSDYFSLGIGSGISPDETNYILYRNNTQLYSFKLNGGYIYSLNKFNQLSLDFGWINQEYLPGVKGNQYDIGIGFKHKF
ncbi:hypothetical protein C3K47_04225 [Solitalea longa]|uniref:YaiO beta-barrel domain-containing protein n=1 Tax=Solitalea longa TaxID=2079460 RepID=A0A2S5A7N7_9SPHI|nr:YaiO family outer membrane beta-barrel protein [Solitalea longa]POY38608.1 hypothetical protein C3K47_04225 [Solitalea longa]